MSRLALALAVVLAGTPALADTLTLHHEGRLVDAEDRPITRPVVIKLALFDAAIGGTSRWSDEFQRTPRQGLYAVTLGETPGLTNEVKPLPIEALAGERWLLVSVDGVELQPRLRIGAVPYAVRAAMLGDRPAEDYALKTGTVQNAELLDGAPASAFARKTDVAPDSTHLAGRPSGDYALKTDTVDNARALAGIPASNYARFGDTVTDSAALGGIAAGNWAQKTDTVANANALAGAPAHEYAKKTDTVSNASSLGGAPASEYAKKTDTVANASALGGSPASDFARRSDTVANASALGGVSASTLLDALGKLRPSALPEGIAMLVGGKLSAGLFPTGAGGVPVLDSEGLIPPSFLPSSSANVLTRTETQVAQGTCFTIEHGWDTRAVGFAAWMSDPSGGPWLPVEPGYEAGATNLALGRPVAASTVYGGSYVTQNAVDGVHNGGPPWLPTTSGYLGWVQVDLGAVKSVSSVKVQTSSSQNSWASTTYEILLSVDGAGFGAAAASGTCGYPGSCTSLITHPLSPNSNARYVRFNALSYGTSAGAALAELEVYSTAYTLSQPSTNDVKLCNYSGVTRDMSLIVWH